MPLPEPVRAPESVPLQRTPSFYDLGPAVPGREIACHPSRFWSSDCQRRRIPGLLPLYDKVSAKVQQRKDARETITPFGIIVDSDYNPAVPGQDDQHATRVRKVAEIATLPDFLQFYDNRASSGRSVSFVNELADDCSPSDSRLFCKRPGAFSRIVNISGAHLFRSSGQDNPSEVVNLIAPEAVRDSEALFVVGTGNFGPDSTRRDFVALDHHPILRLETTPDQPAHRAEALREIHEMTGSLLLVAGLEDSFYSQNYLLTDSRGLPLKNTDGSLRYRKIELRNGIVVDTGSGVTPEAHGNSNRCGDARDFCVLAPYEVTVVTEITDTTVSYFKVPGTSYSTPLVFGTLVNIRYVWPHLTNRQLVKLACETAIDLGNPAVNGCGQFSVSAIWLPTGDLVDPAELLPVARGDIAVSGASVSEPVVVKGYENNEFARDYEISVPLSASSSSLRIEPSVSWNSIKSMIDFRDSGYLSVPVVDGGSAAHLFKGAFFFMNGQYGVGRAGISHTSGFSVAFERETDSFFGSVGSGSYRFGDTNKVIASFDRYFGLGDTYGIGVGAAAAYGEVDPVYSLIKSARGHAQTARVSFMRRKKNFDVGVEFNYSTGLKGDITVQNRNYELNPADEKGVLFTMRFVM